MTRDEILAMEAGDEMNALIAELMGWTRHEQPFTSKWGRVYEWRPPEGSSYDMFLAPHDWSTSIAAAWEVVEKVCEQHSLYFRLHRSADVVWAMFDRWCESRLFVQAQAEPQQPALAISRAALLAVMGVEE